MTRLATCRAGSPQSEQRVDTRVAGLQIIIWRCPHFAVPRRSAHISACFYFCFRVAFATTGSARSASCRASFANLTENSDTSANRWYHSRSPAYRNLATTQTIVVGLDDCTILRAHVVILILMSELDVLIKSEHSRFQQRELRHFAVGAWRDIDLYIKPLWCF